MQQIEFRAMGCRIFAAIDTDDPPALAALNRVPAWFAGWEQTLSRFLPGSELSQLNQRTGQPVAVGPVLWEVLRVSMQAAEQTDGLVTPTLLGALEAAGYDRPFEGPQQTADGGRASAAPAVPPPAHQPPLVSWRAIKLDPRGRTVQAPPGVRLDLGGIAKGWAANEAVRLLEGYGPALVDAGGDIAVGGPMAGGAPWPIGVADPARDGVQLELLALAGGAVATSGRDYRRWRQGALWQHHIIDPRSGQPAATDLLSATVVAPDAITAEAAAKAAMILGSRAGLAWIEQRPPLACLLVTGDGDIIRSRHLGWYLWEG